MKLQLLQHQVQNSGTINGFNYPYCKLLYEKAMKMLKTDFADGNGNLFPIDYNAVAELEKRLAESEEVASINDDESVEKSFFVRNKKDISLKPNTLMPVIMHQIDLQLNMHGSSLRFGHMRNEDIQDVLNYFDKVKNFLAIFE